jgi:hypothetical protein
MTLLLEEEANTEFFAELFTAVLKPALFTRELIEDLAKEFALDIFAPPLSPPPPQAVIPKINTSANDFSNNIESP